MTRDNDRTDDSRTDSEEPDADEALHASIEARNTLDQQYLDDRRPDWYRETFLHEESKNGAVLSLLPKRDSTLPDIPATALCDDVATYVLQGSRSPEVVELKLENSGTYIGRVRDDHVDWRTTAEPNREK